MRSDTDSQWWNLTRSFAVHILTASGAALGLLALVAAVGGKWSLMFVWLGLAVIVDTVDGPMARRLKITERLPRWSGETLDLVVDFVTYDFVPAYAIASSGLLPPWVGLAAGAVIVVTSALYFSDRRMKTADNYFRGFPAVWNVVAFYLFLLKPQPWIGAAAIFVIAALTFVPVVFIHPFRVGRFRALHIAMLMLGLVLTIVAIARDMDPGPSVKAALCVVVAYFIVAGLLRGGGRKRRPTAEVD